MNDSENEVDELDDHSEFGATGSTAEDGFSRRTSASSSDDKRKQRTAIILLGVIGAEYGKEVEQSRATLSSDRKSDDELDRKKSFAEGFGLGMFHRYMFLVNDFIDWFHQVVTTHWRDILHMHWLSCYLQNLSELLIFTRLFVARP